MANLKRYDMFWYGQGFDKETRMSESEKGAWVKFEDVKKIIQQAANDKNAKGCVVCGCNISLQGYCAGCQTRVD